MEVLQIFEGSYNMAPFCLLFCKLNHSGQTALPSCTPDLPVWTTNPSSFCGLNCVFTEFAIQSKPVKFPKTWYWWKGIVDLTFQISEFNFSRDKSENYEKSTYYSSYENVIKGYLFPLVYSLLDLVHYLRSYFQSFGQFIIW